MTLGEVVSHPLPWGAAPGICYDLRFPGAVSAWGPPRSPSPLPAPHPHHGPRTGELLRAWAVENLAFVFASAQGAPPRRAAHLRPQHDHRPPGAGLAQVEEGQGMAIATPDLAAQRTVRSQLPALAHRKIAVGPEADTL